MFAGQGSNEVCGSCTTKQHNAHGTEVREVLYPWHPWFGREVHVHEVVKRGNMPVFWCSTTADRKGQCLAVPSWMFDRAACLHLHPAQAPQVDLAVSTDVRMGSIRVSGAAVSGWSTTISGRFENTVAQ